MIDIIIPVFNAHETIEYTLMSICTQTITEKVKVVLVDDCSEKNYSYLESKFKELEIEIHRLHKNSGSAIARQYGIEHSNNEYIMFLDGDDLLYSPNSLEKLYNEILDDKDCVIGTTYNERTSQLVRNNGDLHGKIYRRKFVEKNKISFNKERFHEDNFFNSLVILNNPRLKIIDEIVYLYHENKNSITAVRKEIEFNRLEVYIKNIKVILDIHKEKNFSENLIKDYLYTKIKYLNKYYVSCNKIEQEIIEKWLSKYLKKFKSVILEEPNKIREKIDKII